MMAYLLIVLRCTYEADIQQIRASAHDAKKQRLTQEAAAEQLVLRDRSTSMYQKVESGERGVKLEECFSRLKP